MDGDSVGNLNRSPPSCYGSGLPIKIIISSPIFPGQRHLIARNSSCRISWMHLTRF